ncbi:MAG: Fe-S cluster assembly protein SufB, partial [archaeon]
MPAKRSSVAEIDYAKYDFRNPEDKGFRLGKGGKGLTREVVEEISALKNEPKWMLDFRLRALETFYKKKMPEWGGNLAEIEFDEITYYMKPAARESADDWNEVPKEI